MPLSASAALSKDKWSGKCTVLFQHRHFAFIAATIKQTHDDFRRMHMAYAFANELEKTNPNFDRDRFLRACGIETL